jgi:hypothetical protein
MHIAYLLDSVTPLHVRVKLVLLSQHAAVGDIYSQIQYRTRYLFILSLNFRRIYGG